MIEPPLAEKSVYTVRLSRQGWIVRGQGAEPIQVMPDLNSALRALTKLTSGNGELCRIKILDAEGVQIHEYYSFSPARNPAWMTGLDLNSEIKASAPAH